MTAVRLETGRPLRVLFVNENIGGHATVHANLARSLAGRDDVVPEFLHVPDPGLPGRLARLPLPVLGPLDLDLQPLRAQLARSAATRRLLGRRLARGGVDAVHLYTQQTGLLSAQHLRSVPTVVSTDSTAELNAYRLPYRAPTRFTPWGVRVALPLERRVLDAARHVVANSALVAASLQACHGLQEDRLTTLAFGVSLPPPPEDRPDRRPTIAFIGHQLERKGGRRLLRLHQEHLRDRCDLLLVTTEHVDPLPGVRVVPDLRGGSDALWPVLASADLFCFPSTIDQAPNAVLEAQAAGLPVVAHPVGAVAEMVVDGVTGLLVPPDDDAALLGALRHFLDDPVARREAGRRARLHVEAEYDMDVAVDRLLAVVRRAVEGSLAVPPRTSRAGA
ncbi:MAG: hypothetical protein JWM64_1121 [Frankiales bacterium]|nr:hypothetical protein [Frankiales bacterium]